jgi:hypothetical protein
VVLKLVDMRGRTLRIIWNGFLEQGSREWTVDLGDSGRPARGVCVMVLMTGQLQLAKKIAIL